METDSTGQWAALGSAVVLLLGALAAGIRKRIQAGKSVLPHIRVRSYLSIRTRSDPPPEGEIDPIPSDLDDTTKKEP